MKELLQVKDHEDLRKDPHSQAVVNVDRRSLVNAKRAKQKRLQELQQQQALEDRVNAIEDKLDSILNLLQNKGG